MPTEKPSNEADPVLFPPPVPAMHRLKHEPSYIPQKGIFDKKYLPTARRPRHQKRIF
ncbi:hypothetical protein EMIT0P2_100095 [Pseudomonas sp. IT-P2]